MKTNRKTRGRHAEKRIGGKKLILVIAVIAILTAAIGVTIAFITVKTEGIKNIFSATEVTCAVAETFENNTKTNVSVTNTSEDVAVYIRAEVLVNWVDSAGNISAEAPVSGTDYSIVLAQDTGWDTETSDGYYYYTAPVAPGGSTGILITECKPLLDKEGYTLKVDILTSALQCEPANAASVNWGVTVSGTNISK